MEADTEFRLLLHRLKAAEAERLAKSRPKTKGSGLTALTGGVAEQLIDNIVMAPLQGAARGGRDLYNIGKGLTPFADMPRIGVIGDQTNILPLPSGREVLSGAQSVLPGNSFEQAMAEREDLASEHPVLSGVGGLAGDAATLATGRLPRGRAVSGGMFDNVISDALNTFSRSMTSQQSVGVKKQIQEIVDSEAFRDLARGAGRAAETGVEGAALAILQGGDPVETAAFSAGMQGVSSGALAWAAATGEAPAQGLKHLGFSKGGPLTKGLIGLGINATIMGVLFNVLGDNPDAAESAAYDKVAYALLAGLVLGLPGKRPKAEGVLKNFPNMADAVLTVPRTAMINIAQQLAEDPVASKVMQVASQTPQFFSEAQAKDMMTWIEEGTFVEKARELYESDESFAELVDTPATLRGVPVKKRRNRGPGFDQ